MTIVELQKYLENISKTTTNEFKRLFHGRGRLYDGFRHLTIDSIDNILSVALYFEEINEDKLIDMLKEFVSTYQKYDTLVVQRRYIKTAPSEILLGDIPQDLYIVENGMKLKLNLLSNKNNYYFADMKKGREFVRKNAKDKTIGHL